MLKKFSLAVAALAMGSTALVPMTPAAAQRYERHERAYDEAYRDGYNRDEYRQTYRDDRRVYRNDRSNRYYSTRQKCRDGDGGTIIGAIAGGLLGRSVAGRGDRTLGTVLGAGAGALAGRAIDRSDRPEYCRR